WQRLDPLWYLAQGRRYRGEGQYRRAQCVYGPSRPYRRLRRCRRSTGDSIFEARLYVRGSVASLGADCIAKEMRDEHREELAQLLKDAGMEDEANDPKYLDSFTRYGS